MFIIENINPYILGCSNKSFGKREHKKYLYRDVKWYEISLITEGNGDGYIVNNNGDETIKAKKGTVILRNPSMNNRTDGPYSRYLVMFDLNYNPDHEPLYNHYKHNETFFAKPTLDTIDHINTDFSGSFVTEQFDLYLELFEAIYQSYLINDIENQFILKTNLMYLIMKVLQEKKTLEIKKDSKSNLVNSKKIDMVKQYIANNLEHEISLNELSEHVDLSREFLCRQFKKVEKTTITNYINNKRLLKAKQALIETNKNIEDISYECGFQNSNYFYKLFKKNENLTPHQYRIYNQSLV